LSGGPRPVPHWYQLQLLAVSEGLCPEHGTALRRDGWCPACRVRWSADSGTQMVTASYPFPGERCTPEP
jgi:hypothetical protein